MKKLNILKTLIDIAFFFMLLGALAIFIFVPIYLCGSEGGLPIIINGQSITAFDIYTKILIALAAIGALLFIYAIYLLRKTLAFFVKRDVFNSKVVHYLDLIGKFLIVSTLLTNIPLLIYNIFSRQHLSIQFNGGGFDSLSLSVSLGLFFMVLSEVFKIAKNLKEENELTV
ncbi:MAG: DUF2975 domain-containing protein [Flavobacterium sp.]|nr:DUF2975 domain-containing protein [Flavobacterium sp.]